LAPVNTTVISILGFGQILMGIWLILPMASLKFYAPFFIPEPLIGIVLLIIGVFITRFSLTANLAGLQHAATAGFTFWIIAAGIMLVNAPVAMGWIAGLIFATYCFMISVNIRVNRRFYK
jgi:hypothetical protein